MRGSTPGERVPVNLSFFQLLVGRLFLIRVTHFEILVIVSSLLLSHRSK